MIVAEDITSRFLNVISLFNGHIPIMAIQFSAIETGEGVGLHFTTVLDTVSREFVDDDEEVAQITDRSYWENRGSRKTISLADKILAICSEFLPSSTEFSYNKHYMGFWIDGRANNFAICRPQKSVLRLDIKIPKSQENDQFIESAELDCLTTIQDGNNIGYASRKMILKTKKRLFFVFLEVPMKSGQANSRRPCKAYG